MRVGILQTGRLPDALLGSHPDYPGMFERLLAGHGFDFRTWAVLDGEMPGNIDAADGWLITGSKFGVYEDHPWIPPLEGFLRKVHAAKRPLVGICLGHQLIAQALGGRVEKFDGGWSVGAVEYRIDGERHKLLAWHQDQVVSPPEGAALMGSSDFCRYAALSYGAHAFSIQPHPEFTPTFLTDLCRIRGASLPPETLEALDIDRFAQADPGGIAARIAQILKGAPEHKVDPGSNGPLMRGA